LYRKHLSRHFHVNEETGTRQRACDCKLPWLCR
jgi:hypothetical protein